MHSHCFKAGFRAYKEGAPISTNPYPMLFPESHRTKSSESYASKALAEWNDGWKAARQETEQRISSQEETQTLTKPPLGLRPTEIWVRNRVSEITGAIDRFNAAGEAIPEEWIDELVVLSVPNPLLGVKIRHQANPVPKGQSRKASLVEAVTNIAVGLIISWTVTLLLLRWLGYPISMGETAGMSVVFTIISLVRSYALRRVFNYAHCHRGGSP